MAKKEPEKGQQQTTSYNPNILVGMTGMKSSTNEYGEKYFYPSAQDTNVQDMKLFQTTVYENGEVKTGIDFIVSLEHTKLISYIIGLSTFSKNSVICSIETFILVDVISIIS